MILRTGLMILITLLFCSSSFSSDTKLDTDSYDLKGIELLLKKKDLLGSRVKKKQLQLRLSEDHKQFKRDEDRRTIDLYMNGLDKIFKLVEKGQIEEAIKGCSNLEAKIQLDKKSHN